MRGFAELATAAWPAAGSSLTGPIGKERRFTWVRASLDDVKLIKRELGGTVNNVVLAAITGGLRALLLARGGRPGRHMVRSLVPVSVRAPGEENVYGNRCQRYWLTSLSISPIRRSGWRRSRPGCRR